MFSVKQEILLKSKVTKIQSPEEYKLSRENVCSIAICEKKPQMQETGVYEGNLKENQKVSRCLSL